MPPLKQVIWKLAPRDEAAENELAQAAGIHTLIAAILRARGITSPEAVRDFLSTDLNSLRDPFELPDMRAAAERIVMAVGNNEPLLVHGDYDADGITATALLVRFLSKLGADVHYYIPHRINDRYGLSLYAIRQAVAKGINLIIAVDCGVSDNDEIAEANKLGAEVIVIDHHEPGPELPDALVVDYKRHDFEGEADDLAAVGLAYKVAAAVCMLLEMPVISLQRAFLDLVAIGTVADVVKLSGDNRIMVKWGLELLPSTRKEGLQALMDLAGLAGELTAQDIGFRLAPRLNAIGRMAQATDAVDLLLEDDPDAAMKLALQLEGYNTERRRQQELIFCEAEAMACEQVDLDSEPVIVLAGDNWHIGVVGIVASKVVERFHRPAFLMSRKDDIYRGSARSVEGFDIAAGLQQCDDLLLRYGGHQLAGGFSLPIDNLEDFRTRLNDIGRTSLRPQHLLPTINIDCEVDIGDVAPDLVEALGLMKPFGHGNRPPVLMSSNVEVADVRTVGSDGKHLKLLVGAGHLVFDCIGFGMGSQAAWISRGSRIDLAYTPEFNEYNGQVSLQLRLAAVRPTNT
jgi:single-stranded-DNA-specific exonuclease